MIWKFFDLEIPIIQAPMAGVTTPELVAVVSNAGALGSLGAGYLTPDEIKSSILRIKSLTKKPFNVNLFIPEKKNFPYDESAIKELLIPFWQKISSAPFEVSPFPSFTFEEQVSILLEEKIPFFSFTFGLLASDLIKEFQKGGTKIIGTATTPEEALALEEAGVDAIVCQGYEAGGHRGGFSLFDPLYGLSPLLLLTKKKVKTPLIAAGGIMNGFSAKAFFHIGACAVQLGTAFLTTTESKATYKKILLENKTLPTVLTKAFTGKPARAIKNSFIETFENFPTAPFPIQHFLTHQLRKLATEQQDYSLMSLWAGQGYPLCQSIPTQRLIQELVKDMKKN